MGRREQRIPEERASHHSLGIASGVRGLSSSLTSLLNSHNSHSNRIRALVQARRTFLLEAAAEALVAGAAVVVEEVEVATEMAEVAGALAATSGVTNGGRDRRCNRSFRIMT